MAQPSTLYRFRIELSDVDRGLYMPLDFRLAMHPSETLLYLITRAIAYALNFDEELEISPEGLADPDAPAMRKTQPGTGRTSLWVEIGNPSARKIHKASKAADLVKIYTYKDPTLIQKECQDANVFRAETVEIYALDTKFLDKLSQEMQREMRLSVLHNEGSLSVNWGEQHASCEIKRYSL